MLVAAWQTAYRGIVPQAYLDQLSAAARATMWTELIEGGGLRTDLVDELGDGRVALRDDISDALSLAAAGLLQPSQCCTKAIPDGV